MTDKISLFCILDGESTVFSVKILPTKTVDELKKAIKKEIENDLQGIDADELNLYHVSVLDEGTTVNIADVESKEPLTRATSEISKIFGTAPLPKRTIHIVVQRPLEGNMNDPSALNKLRYVIYYVYILSLVSTFGSEFPLLHREETLDVLWNGAGTLNGVFKRFERRGRGCKMINPIPFLACGPGTGKSRFLQEIAGMLREKASSCSDQSVKSAFSNMVSINFSYGNDTAASQFDVRIEDEASIA
ncbi:hypothetical protein BX616_007570, partial [Lobosporangium transversale]